MLWRNSDGNWEIGAGLASGDSNPRSTNYLYSSDGVFSTGDTWLDYAYAKHKFAASILTIGQQQNPFLTNLFWTEMFVQLV